MNEEGNAMNPEEQKSEGGDCKAHPEGAAPEAQPEVEAAPAEGEQPEA